MPWTKLDQSKLRNVGGIHAKLRNVYGIDGAVWPRLTLSIYEGHESECFWPGSTSSMKIECSIKTEPSAHWEKSPIPVELSEELIGIIREYQEKTNVKG